MVKFSTNFWIKCYSAVAFLFILFYCGNNDVKALIALLKNANFSSNFILQEKWAK